MINVLERFREIETFFFDVDGVLTNGQIFVEENGLLLRNMNVRDGYALKLAVRKGYRVAIFTGGKSIGVKKRLQNLGIQDIFLASSPKTDDYETYLAEHEIDEETILYMGDDMPDLELMRRVGFPCAPYDACSEILQIARYVSPINGGQGCVRDVIEKVLKLRGDWE